MERYQKRLSKISKGLKIGGEDMKDRRLFAEYMTLLGETFSREISTLLIEAYWQALKKYSDEECKLAFDMAVSNCKFFPKPVEIIDFIKFGEAGGANLDDIAYVEADKVIRAVAEIGQYQSVTFDDPVTMAVIKQGWGGWIKLCELKDEEIKWFRKDFAKIYKAYANTGIKKYGYLVGQWEFQNLEHGYPDHVPEPVLIGNEDRALIVQNKNKPKLIKG
jgi:hypothetical protein